MHASEFAYLGRVGEARDGAVARSKAQHRLVQAFSEDAAARGCSQQAKTVLIWIREPNARAECAGKAPRTRLYSEASIQREGSRQGGGSRRRLIQTPSSSHDILEGLQAEWGGPWRLHGTRGVLPLRLCPLLLAAQLPHHAVQGGAGGGKGAGAAAGGGIAPGCETPNRQSLPAAAGPAGRRGGTPAAASSRKLQHCRWRCAGVLPMLVEGRRRSKARLQLRRTRWAAILYTCPWG